MRLWVCLVMAGSMLAFGGARVAAESDRKSPGGDKATTKPDSNAERGEKDAESHRSGRSGHGSDRPYRPFSDDRSPAGNEASGHREGRGFGGPWGDGEHRGGPMFGASPERTERMMAFLKEQYPQLYERLNELKEKDEHAFHRQLGRMLPRMPELMNIIEGDPTLGKLIIDEHRLEMDIRDALVEYRETKDEGAISQLKGRIRDLISKQFDVRQEKLKLMIANMERELERKKQYLKEQAAKKDKVIDRELQRRLEPDI